MLVLPNSVRYVKNGAKGKWWEIAKAKGQIHAQWDIVDNDLLKKADLDSIKGQIRAHFGRKPGATQDFKALEALLVGASQHLWITFQDGCMWWCTVRDGIELNPNGKSDKKRGHFWLTCESPWSNRSIGNKRHLLMSELPGTITTVAGYRATVCQPKAWDKILSIIRNEENEKVLKATQAREAYVEGVGLLVTDLKFKDFELLIDLILSRSGWARLAKLGGVTEAIDIEAENVAIDEIAFVQVKSSATQAVFDDSLANFNNQRERFHRMIFAVHSPKGILTPPKEQPVSIWTSKEIANRVVRLGLGDWVASRL